MRYLAIMAILFLLPACSLAMQQPADAAVTPSAPPTQEAATASAPPPTQEALAAEPSQDTASLASAERENAAAASNNGECWATNNSSAAVNVYRDRDMQQVYGQIGVGERTYVTQIVRNYDNPAQIDWVTTRLPGGGTGYFSAAGLTFEDSCAPLLAAPPPPQECLATNIADAALDVYSDTTRAQVVYQLAPLETVVVTQVILNAQDSAMTDWFIVQLENGTVGYLFPNALSLSDACAEIVPVQ
ncbi:MAG: hypothetical protein U0694_01605 [Anaerolineae bacterium]